MSKKSQLGVGKARKAEKLPIDRKLHSANA